MTGPEILQTIAEWLIDRGAVEPLYSALYDGTPDDILDVPEVILRWLSDEDITFREVDDVIDMIFPQRDVDFYTHVYNSLLAIC